MDNFQQPFIIFLHIQKTGGITAQRILRRKLGKPLIKRSFSLIKKDPEGLSIEEIFKQKKLEDRYIVGHFCYGIHRSLPKPYTYMAFLREPVSRIISLYSYSKSNPTAYYHKFAVSKTLEEFALEAPLMELDNGQVRFLAGDSNDYFINRSPLGECDSELLEKAKKNIDSEFSFVGLTEYFDESILLLKEIMGWKSCLYLRRNTRTIKARDELSMDIKDRISKRNWLDVKLYEYSRQVLLTRLSKASIDNRLVVDFRRKNAVFNDLYGPVYTFYDQMKALVRGQYGRPS